MTPVLLSIVAGLTRWAATYCWRKGLYWICFTAGFESRGGMITTAKTARMRRANTQRQLWSPPDWFPEPPGVGPRVPPGVGRPERRSGKEGLITPWYAPRLEH